MINIVVKRNIEELRADMRKEFMDSVINLRERLRHVETIIDTQQKRLDELERYVRELGKHVYSMRKRNSTEDPPNDPQTRQKPRPTSAKVKHWTRELASALLAGVGLALVGTNILLMAIMIYTATKLGMGFINITFYASYGALLILGIWAGYRASVLANKYQFRSSAAHLVLAATPLAVLALAAYY